MEFKIDAKPTYTVIMPDSVIIDAKLAELIAEKCKELSNNGSKNFLLDFKNARSAHSDSFDILVELAASLYENDQSFVITGLDNELIRQMKETEVFDMLNITPTTAEAIDIISMEILERDLLDEE